MLSEEERKILYDPKNFKGVSPQTRTDIIDTIDLDIQGWEQEEGKKFTHEELCNGLHYLLATDKDLYRYIEKNNQQVSSLNDPFIISSRELSDLGMNLFIRHPVSCFYGLGVLTELDPGCCCCLGFAGNIEGLFIGCAFLYVLIVILGVFWHIYKNICDTLKSKEYTAVKMVKLTTNLIVFIGITGVVWFFLPTIYVVGLSSTLAIFCGAVATALFSYVNKKILCFPRKQNNPNELLKPSKELLEDLEVIEKILKYSREGDDKKACMDFVKTVVRMHIKSISKLANVKSSSFVGGHGSFFPEQPANEAHQNREDTPSYSASQR